MKLFEQKLVNQKFHDNMWIQTVKLLSFYTGFIRCGGGHVRKKKSLVNFLMSVTLKEKAAFWFFSIIL